MQPVSLSLSFYSTSIELYPRSGMGYWGLLPNEPWCKHTHAIISPLNMEIAYLFMHCCHTTIKCVLLYLPQLEVLSPANWHRNWWILFANEEVEYSNEAQTALYHRTTKHLSKSSFCSTSSSPPEKHALSDGRFLGSARSSVSLLVLLWAVTSQHQRACQRQN